MNKWILLLLLFCPTFLMFGVDAETIYDNDHYYITSGVAALDIPVKELTAVLTDYNSYRNWVLKGIDGKDPRSAKYNLILSDVKFVEKYSKFILIFDVNLFWPFNSKGNRIYFDFKQHISPEGLLKSIEFKLSKSTILVPWASLSLDIYENGDESIINFKSKIKLAWYINIFFSLKGYKRNFERRIVNIIRNLRELFHKDIDEKKKEKPEHNPGEVKEVMDKIFWLRKTQQ